MGVIKDFFKKVVGAIPGAKHVVNLVPGVCVECDPHAEAADTAGVHYNHAKITHKQAVRKMAEYGMSANYNIHDKKWIVKYERQLSVSDSFREAVEAIKV